MLKTKEECLERYHELVQALKLHGLKICVAGHMHNQYNKRLDEFQQGLFHLPPNERAWVWEQMKQANVKTVAAYQKEKQAKP